MTFQRMSFQRTALPCVLLVIAIGSLGCGGYGKTSPLAYEHAKSLYTVCNLKNSEVLEKVSKRILAERDANDLSAEEANWLTDIVETARAGDWKTACAACREILEAQVTGKP